MASSELADFLRAHRQALTPAQVGLPASRRRRTPGLRREEVAALAGISIEYLIRLEQGRDTNPSSSVLAALSSALQLTDDERHHLAMLVLRTTNDEMCGQVGLPSEEVAPSTALLLRRLEPSPAAVTGPYGDLLTWNGVWTRLVAPLGLLDGPRPNLARFLFDHPSAPSVYPDWDEAADEQARQLRSAMGKWAHDDRLQALVAELSANPAFAARWSTHEVAEKRRGTRRLAHPTFGMLQVTYEVLQLGDGFDQHLLVWFPGDARTEAVFDELAAGASATGIRAGRLRVVGSD